MGVHTDGYAFAICLVSSNLLEIEINEAVIIFRSTGGVLDFYVITGHNPTHVIKQYHSLVGRTFMPPILGIRVGLD